MGAGSVSVAASGKMAMPHKEKLPVFDGEGASALDFEQQAQMWMRRTKTDPANRDPLLVPICVRPRDKFAFRRVWTI